MVDIYQKHDRAFNNCEAFVIAKNGERVAKVAFKIGNAVTAYVHWLGLEMTFGTANGGGYDRRSAACSAAAIKAIKAHMPEDREATQADSYRATFFRVLRDTDCGTWESDLRAAGFDVWSAL